MSRAAEIAAARMRAKQTAPGLGTPSDIPTEQEAAQERRALQQLDAHTFEAEVGDLEVPTVQAQAVAKPPVVAPEKEEKKEEKPVDLMDLISKLPNGPSRDELTAWKQQFPEVLVLPLRDNEVYIYRYLNHYEWRKQLLTQEKLVQDQEALKDAVLARCVLWPRLSPVEVNTRQAGLRDLLYDIILKSSYFIEPEQALNLVMRL